MGSRCKAGAAVSQNHDAAHEKGRKAGLDGVTVDRNPYQSHILRGDNYYQENPFHRSWYQGWLAGTSARQRTQEAAS